MFIVRLLFRWFIRPLVDRLVFPLIGKIWDAVAGVVLSLGGWWGDMPKQAAARSEAGLEDQVGSLRQWTGFCLWILLALAAAWFFGGKALPVILTAAFVVTLRKTASAGASLPRAKFIAIWKKKLSNPLAGGALVLLGVIAPVALTLLNSSLDRAAGIAAWAIWIISAHIVAADCAKLHKEDRMLTAQYSVPLGKSFGVSAQAFDDMVELHMVDGYLIIKPAPPGATSAATRAEIEPALANWLPDFEFAHELSNSGQLALKPLTLEGGERRELLKATQGMIQRFDDLPVKEMV